MIAVAFDLAARVVINARGHGQTAPAVYRLSAEGAERLAEEIERTGREFHQHVLSADGLRSLTVARDLQPKFIADLRDAAEQCWRIRAEKKEGAR